MRLLLDTHILMALIDGSERRLARVLVEAIQGADALFVSAASFWEIAIKHRLGKLALPCALIDTPDAARAVGVQPIDIRLDEVLIEVEPWPATNDPFDRVLLAVCKARDLRLVTIDRLLVDHPLAWRPSAA